MNIKFSISKWRLLLMFGGFDDFVIGIDRSNGKWRDCLVAFSFTSEGFIRVYRKGLGYNVIPNEHQRYIPK